MQSDDELIVLLKKGEVTGLDGLFNRYYSDLCNFSSSYVNDIEAAKEIIQDLFVNLWNKRTNIEIRTSLKSYLFISAKNGSLNYLKSRQAKHRTHLSMEGLAHPLVQGPDHELIGKYLTSKHLTRQLSHSTDSNPGELLALAREERWKEVFLFIVDELPTSDLENVVLQELLTLQSDTALQIVAYAIDSKRNAEPPLASWVRDKYAEACLERDRGYVEGILADAV